MRDYTREAEHLFRTFAERHELAYIIDDDAPMEAAWSFPIQPRLSIPIWLGLQNLDELNFGVGALYTYMFPFPKIEKQFALILDAWVSGEARVKRASPWQLVLQVRHGADWKTVYRQMSLLPEFRGEPAVLQNGRSGT